MATKTDNRPVRTLSFPIEDGLRNVILDGEGGETVLPVILTEARNVTVRNVKVRGRHRLQRCVYLYRCVGCTVENVEASDAHTYRKKDRDGREGHNFQANGGKKNRFVDCWSRSTRVDGIADQEDHYSLIGETGSGVEHCHADGPVNTSGTGFCIDVGSKRCRLIDNVENVYGLKEPRGSTVLGFGHVIKDNRFSSVLGVEDVQKVRIENHCGRVYDMKTERFVA